MKGRLNTRISADNGKRSTVASSMEMPVTPPSMKWLDSKNPFRPKAAEATPAKMKAAFLSSELGALTVAAVPVRGSGPTAPEVGFLSITKVKNETPENWGLE